MRIVMTIANELDSEIAFALVSTSDKEPSKLDELKELLFEVHSTLQKLSEQSRRARALSRAARANEREIP